jgi:hypothetical protein
LPSPEDLGDGFVVVASGNIYHFPSDRETPECERANALLAAMQELQTVNVAQVSLESEEFFVDVSLQVFGEASEAEAEREVMTRYFLSDDLFRCSVEDSQVAVAKGEPLDTPLDGEGVRFESEGSWTETHIWRVANGVIELHLGGATGSSGEDLLERLERHFRNAAEEQAKDVE